MTYVKTYLPMLKTHVVNLKRDAKDLSRDLQRLEVRGKLGSWIIERLDRKLADSIGSNIEEKCDVTLSRAIQPLTSDVFRVLLFIAYFISVYDYTDCPCFEVKDEEDLPLEKIVRWYKTGRGKR